MDDELTIRTEANNIVTQARQCAITNNAEYEAACELFLGVKALKKKFLTWWEPIRINLQDSLARGREIAKNCDLAEEIIEPKLSAWKAAQFIREQKMQAMMQGAVGVVLEDMKVRDAALATQLGEDALAEEIRQAEIIQRLVSAPTLTPEVAGVSYRDHWEGRVDDEDALIKFAMSRQEFRHFIILDQGAINAAVRKARGQITIPGVTVVHEDRPTGRV